MFWPTSLLCLPLGLPTPETAALFSTIELHELLPINIAIWRRKVVEEFALKSIHRFLPLNLIFDTMLLRVMLHQADQLEIEVGITGQLFPKRLAGTLAVVF